MASASSRPPGPSTAGLIDPAAKDAFWLAVEECLIRFHRFDTLGAIQRARSSRQAVESAPAGIFRGSHLSLGAVLRRLRHRRDRRYPRARAPALAKPTRIRLDPEDSWLVRIVRPRIFRSQDRGRFRTRPDPQLRRPRRPHPQGLRVAGRLPGGAQGIYRDGPRQGRPGRQGLGAARAGRRRVPDRPEVELPAEGSDRKRSCASTATRASRRRSTTGS